MTTKVDTDATRSRLGTIASAGIVTAVAFGLSCLGTALAISLVGTNVDGKAFAVGLGYFACAIIGPVALGVYVSRFRAWDWVRSARLSAVLSLIVHAFWLPVALAALAM